MNEGFQTFFARFGEWPWRSPREYRQRELVEATTASASAVVNAIAAVFRR